MRLVRDVARADRAAAVRAVEDVIVFLFQMRRALDGHRARDVEVRVFDLGLAEAKLFQDIELRVGERVLGEADAFQGRSRDCRRVERELYVEGFSYLLVDRRDLGIGKAFFFERSGVHGRGSFQRAVSESVTFDLADLTLSVTKTS